MTIDTETDPQPFEPKTEVNLIPPFFRGDGKDLNDFVIFYNDVELSPGMVMSTETYQLFTIISCAVQEDFFENIGAALCRMLSTNPNESINPNTRQLHYLYSAHTSL